MKNVITLISALLVFSITANADGIGKNKKKRNKEYYKVAIAQLVTGDEDEDAPLEIAYLKAKNAMVPVAPFEWAAPLETAPGFLKTLKAKNAFVPVAPFVWGNSFEEAPEVHETAEIKNIKHL